MRPTFFRKIVAGLAAFALVVALGLQSVHGVAMAALHGNDAVAAMTMNASAGNCGQCDSSHESTVAHCQPICAPSVAVLPVSEAIARMSLPAYFEVQDVTRVGRTGVPEPHPPKSAPLL